MAYSSTLNVSQLSPKVRSFVEEKVRLCQPDNIHICDGSEEENKYLLEFMKNDGLIEPLTKYENWYDFIANIRNDLIDLIDFF